MTTQRLADEVLAFVKSPRRLLIDGEWVHAAGGSTLQSINPASGEVLGTVAAGGPADIDAAVSAAEAAFRGPWARTTPAERTQLLWRVGQLIREHAEELAQLETLDQGKPLAFARMEVLSAAATWEYYAGWATKIEGRTSTLAMPGMDFHSYTLRQPLGVVGLIIPWNFPIMMASYKTAPALAAGCTAVLKPDEHTSLTALRLGELIQEAGIPSGTVNIVTGRGPEAGAALVAHPGVAKVSFTGSTEVGKKIVETAAAHLPKLTLELGGKSPNIIFADADIDAAIQGSASAIFYNQGEVCTAGSRIYVEENIFDDVVNGLAQASTAFAVGDGLDESTLMGPVISDTHLERIAGYVRRSRAEGAEVVAGGNSLDRPGYFYEPTVITGADPTMTIVREEVFGPVVTVHPFADPEAVLVAANDSVYGLAAGVWTRDISRAHRFARSLDGGIVWINCWQMSDPGISTGGLKQSGWGYDFGENAVLGYTHEKSVVAAL